MTAYTPPSHVSSGEADSAQFNEETVDNIKHLKEVMPHVSVTKVAGGGGTTSSTSNVDLPTALAKANFEKYHDDTALLVRVSGHYWFDDAVATLIIAIDRGGTDTDIHRADSLGAASANSFAADILITGVAAGTIPSIKVQWRVGSGSNVATMNGIWGLTIMEVLP
jgi:hypothetical protein